MTAALASVGFDIATVRKLYPSPLDIALRCAGNAKLSAVQTLELKLCTNPIPPLTDGEVRALAKIVPQSAWSKATDALKALFGQPKRRIPLQGFDRFVARKGRRSGGTIHLGAPLCVFNALQAWDSVLAPGEQIRILIVAPQLDQCKTALNACAGILDILGVPYARREGEIDLSNAGLRSIIRADVADELAGRSPTCAFCFVDEAFKLNTDPNGAHPDREVIASILPSLATTRPLAKTVGMLAIGSPVSTFGYFHDAVEKNIGRLDSRTFACVVPSFASNPVLDEAKERENCDDDVIFSREWLAIPRSGPESFLSIEIIRPCVAPGVLYHAPVKGTTYVVAIDAAFAHDHFALMVGHLESGIGPNAERRDLVVIDLVEVYSPKRGAALDFHDMMLEVSRICKTYNGALCVRDNYSDAAIGAELLRLGVQSEVMPMSPSAQSSRFRNLARLFKSRLIQLPDNPELVKELLDLRRTIHQGGRESFEAKSGAFDDQCDALALLAEKALTLLPGGNSAVQARRVVENNLGRTGEIKVGFEWYLTEIDPLTGERRERLTHAPAGTAERRRDVFDFLLQGKEPSWVNDEDRRLFELDRANGLPADCQNLPRSDAPTFDDGSVEASREYWKTVAGTRSHPTNGAAPMAISAARNGDDWWRKNAGLRSHPTDGRLTKKIVT